jgi:uncharacterized protein (TIGR00730 family)
VPPALPSEKSAPAEHAEQDEVTPLDAQPAALLREQPEAPAQTDGAAALLVDELAGRLGLDELPRPDLYRKILETLAQLARDHTDALDLKIVSAALSEMSEAFRVFRPYRHERKVTFFGSARTAPDAPLYNQARALAERLGTEGWMTVTGAGPGIMAAGMAGAGRDRSIGVNIRLPHEQGANDFIAHDPKLVVMRYFFTRKLMLIKESDGYAVLPGGFGTLDEAYELLTLLQTGKAQPAPLVLLDVPEGNYWQAWERFLVDEVVARGLISPADRSLFRITSDVGEAVDELLGFYRNYHSCRWVGNLLVVRLQHEPSRAELHGLNSRFDDILDGGEIRHTRPLSPERTSLDHLELPRVSLRFNRVDFGRLRQLIDAFNQLAT